MIQEKYLAKKYLVNEKAIFHINDRVSINYIFYNSTKPMQQVAKIIRHRHSFHHYINEHLKGVSEDVHFKIIFSHPSEMEKFEQWCIKNKGKYDYDKELNKQNGKMPKLKEFKGKEICFCDIMQFYLLNIEGYTFYSTTSPYNGEIYYKVVT